MKQKISRWELLLMVGLMLILVVGLWGTSSSGLKLGSQVLAASVPQLTNGGGNESSTIVSTGTGAGKVLPAVQIGTLADTGIFGQVGIGTATPTPGRLLHIVGNICLFERAQNSAGFIINRTGGASANRWVFGVDEPTGFVIKTYPVDGGGAVEQLVISKDDPGTGFNEGKVGIGTSSPTSKLHVVNTDTTANAKAIYGETTAASTIGVAGNSTNYIGVYGSSSGGSGSGVGVYGYCVDGTGTYGYSTDWFGVHGDSNSSHGVHGRSTNDVGVYGENSTSGNFGYLGNDDYGVYGSATAPDYAGYFQGNAQVTGTLGILEGGTSPTFSTVFQGGDQSGNITYTLPTSAGTSGQALTTDGTGVLSWTTSSSLPSGTSGQTLRYDDTNALVANSLLFNNGTRVGVNTTIPNTLSTLHVVNTDTTNQARAIYGTTTAAGTIGIAGNSTSYYGVYGSSSGGVGSGVGVYGYCVGGTGTYGYSTDWFGVHGDSNSSHGVHGRSTNDVGVYGENSTSSNYGYLGGSSYAGYFSGNARVTGNLTVDGTLTKGSGTFKIDHPQDPENKYLSHSFVESPDMKNVYDGNVVLDGNGEAVVELPSYFEALNRDFRYQLTAIGAPAPNLYIAQKISGNYFRIAGGTPGMEVSWQVTGIRQDPFANAHPVQVEQEKPANEKGLYLHPKEWGQPEEKGVTER